VGLLFFEKLNIKAQKFAHHVVLEDKLLILTLVYEERLLVQLDAALEFLSVFLFVGEVPLLQIASRLLTKLRCRRLLQISSRHTPGLPMNATPTK
jgi:hypothetical protein